MFKEKEQFRNVLIQNDLIYAICLEFFTNNKSKETKFPGF
jgi:hypothetical protein